MEAIYSNLQGILPFAIAAWVILLVFVYIWPQRLFNCYLLFNALLWTYFFAGCFFGDNMVDFVIMGMFAILIIILFVPLMLSVNGIVMIKREGKSLQNALSLLLGIGIGAGEIAFISTVFIEMKEDAVLSLGKITTMIGVSALYFSIIILAFVLYSILVDILPHRYNFNYVVIHGCGLTSDGKVSNILRARADRAIKIYEKCRKKPILIPSGGKGADEVRSEAEAMEEYLLEHGIPKESIILEDRSTTTEENLKFSNDIIEHREGKRKTALVSSNYHVYRCLRYARRMGIKCTGIGSHVAWYYWPSALIREWVAVYTEPVKLIPMGIVWILLMIAVF